MLLQYGTLINMKELCLEVSNFVFLKFCALVCLSIAPSPTILQYYLHVGLATHEEIEREIFLKRLRNGKILGILYLVTEMSML